MDSKHAISMIDQHLLEPNSINQEWVECLTFCKLTILQAIRLKEELENVKSQFHFLDIECCRLEKQTEEQQAEIERLKRECRETRRDLLNEIISLEHQLKTAESEAIKEFAERLKEYNLGIYSDVKAKIINEDIDNLVKERTEGKDEHQVL